MNQEGTEGGARPAETAAAGDGGDRAGIDRAFKEALEHHNAGRIDAAEEIYRGVLETEPDNPDAQHLLGVLAMQRGSLNRAVRRIRRAIAISPNEFAYHNNLANALTNQGNTEEAETQYRRAIELKPDYAEAHHNYGNLLRGQRKLEEALESYRRALGMEPHLATSFNNAATTLVALGRPEEAVEIYRKGLDRHPGDGEMTNNLGSVLRLVGKPEEALKIFHQVIENDANNVLGLRNLAGTIKDLGDPVDAEKPARKAVELAPGDAPSLDTLGNVLFAQRRVDEAIEKYDEVLRRAPDLAATRGNRSMALLLRGDFEEGWKEYEWRWASETFTSPRRSFPKPVWDGAPLDGRSILLYTEQGMGDALQFARYIPMVADRGGRVILGCQSELARLLGAMPGVSEVISQGTLPDFACHAPLMSLPRILGTRLDSIPAEVPYLHADEELIAKWADRIGGAPGFKVGIVWRGNPGQRVNRVRSCPAELLGTLAAVPGVSLFSLQKHAPDRDPETPQGMTDLGGDLDDFAETAAAISHLDLVISVCTSVAHLAGALARPTWVMLSFAADWRWLLDRDDSPWYPTTRLFRQPEPGDWQAVVDRVAKALEDLTTQ